MGSYNPNYPTVLGNEFGPVATDPVAIDTGSAFGYTFRSTDVEDLIVARVMMPDPPPGQAARKIIAWELYNDDYAPATGPMRKILVPCTSGANVTGTTLINAATYQEAMENPTDGKGVFMAGPSAAVRLWFDVSATNVALYRALQNNRIIDVTVRYTMAGNFDEYAVPMQMSLERPSASVIFPLDDTITGAVGSALNTVPRRARIGDMNPFWSTTNNPLTNPFRAPWVHLNGFNNHIGLEALAASGGTNIALRFQSSADVPVGVTAFTFSYCALEITYAAEGRRAAGGYDIGGGTGISDGMFTTDVPIYNVSGGYGQPLSLTGGQDMLMVVGQGYCGNVSVSYPVPVTIPRLIPARDTFRGHRGVVLRKTLREGEEWTREASDSFPPLPLYTSDSVYDETTIYPPSQVYSAQLLNPVAQLTFPGEAYAELLDDDAGNEYTHVRFYARRYPGTRDYLRVYGSDSSDAFVGPYALITVEEFEELPEIANGWKEVTLELSAPWVSAGSGTTRWQFDSGTDTAFPWEVLGADANAYRQNAGAYSGATYGSDDAYAQVDGVADLNADMSLMLIQALPVPAGLQVNAAVQPLALVDEHCGVPVPAIPTGIRFHELSWEPVNDLSVAGFGYYEVQRRDTTMAADEWETIAEITNVTATETDDYEARIGVESSYRVRVVHEDGYTSAWSSTITATIAAPGVTGSEVDRSVLVLTSNHNPDGNLAYVMAFDNNAPVQQFEYPEAGDLTLQEMYNRDYRVAFRPLERGGTEFTRTLMLNAAGVPAQTLSNGALALRDLAWDTVPYVCVRDELNNRWLAALSVPTSATRDVATAGHLVLAPVTISEVTATPAPVDHDGTCQGTRLEGVDNFQYWTTPRPAALGGTNVITDTFDRGAVASGWGSATSGQAWTTVNGSAANYNTTGTAGTIVSGNVTTQRRVISAPTLASHRSKVSMTIPAVATAGTFTAGLIARYQDDSNFYAYKVAFLTTGQFRLELSRMVAGVETTIVTGGNVSSYTVGTVVHLETMTRGTTLLARVWKDAADPPAWDEFTNAVVFQQSQTTLALTGRVGVSQIRAAANTNGSLTISYDNFTADSLPEELDFRVLVRPFADTFNVQFGVDEYTNDTDSEGGWAFYLGSDEAQWLVYGNDTTQIAYTDTLSLGLVKNRLTWVRMVLTQDDGTGTQVAEFYTLEDDGVTWTLVATETAAAPTQPIPPLAAGAFIQVENFDPGGIWTSRYELRVDGVLVASPDFADQAIGTEVFADDQGNTWTGPEGRGICATLE